MATMTRFGFLERRILRDLECVSGSDDHDDERIPLADSAHRLLSTHDTRERIGDFRRYRRRSVRPLQIGCSPRPKRSS